MYLYRIEHIQSGKGPYIHTPMVCNEEGRWICYAHNTSEYPAIWEEFKADKIAGNLDEYHCAFDTAEKLVQWFTGWLEILERHHFIVAIYSAEEYYTGATQSIFRGGTWVESLSIPEFLQYM